MEAGHSRRSRRSQLVISLYFHIPFCSKKCPYCHFYVVPNRLSFHSLLLEALEREWEQKLPLLQGKTIASIYFGGGTPTLFAPRGIAALLQKIRNSGCNLSSDCEITIEANPEEGSEELFTALFALGINRLSIGVQSLDDRSLQTLERTHSAQKAKSALFAAKRSGFRNVSIDLMYDLPDQTEASWRYTLDQLTDLPFQHLSLYNLTIEPHTSFYKRRHTLSLPSSETSLRFLLMAIQTLESLGLKRYEISAFAKTGFTSRHNIGYWTGRPFLGFGPSAFSYWENERFRNDAHLERYARALKENVSPVDFRETLPLLQRNSELLAVRLRLLEGADLSLFQPLSSETKQAIDRCVEYQLLQRTDSLIRLTERGLLLYDSVATELIEP